MRLKKPTTIYLREKNRISHPSVTAKSNGTPFRVMDSSKQTYITKSKNKCERFENKQKHIPKKKWHQIREHSELDIERGKPKWTQISWTLKHYGMSVRGEKKCSVLLSISRSDLRVSIVTHLVICVFSPLSPRSSPNRWVLKKAGGVLAPTLNHDTCRPAGTSTSHHGLPWPPTTQKAGWSVPLFDYDAIAKTNLEYVQITSFG